MIETTGVGTTSGAWCGFHSSKWVVQIRWNSYSRSYITRKQQALLVHCHHLRLQVIEILFAALVVHGIHTTKLVIQQRVKGRIGGEARRGHARRIQRFS